MEMTYKNHSRNGLINKHKYLVKIFPPSKGRYVYDIHFIYDITLQEEMDMVMNYASIISIRHNFDYDKFQVED